MLKMLKIKQQEFQIPLCDRANAADCFCDRTNAADCFCDRTNAADCFAVDGHNLRLDYICPPYVATTLHCVILHVFDKKIAITKLPLNSRQF